VVLSIVSLDSDVKLDFWLFSWRDKKSVLILSLEKTVYPLWGQQTALDLRSVLMQIQKPISNRYHHYNIIEVVLIKKY
jgi:hypothetical protein